MIEDLKTKPTSNNQSPSFNGKINFDLIGTGGLPLQGSEGAQTTRREEVPRREAEEAPSLQDVITGSIFKFQTSEKVGTHRRDEKRPSR